MSMEDLQLPRAKELESQTLRPVKTQTLRACTHEMRTLFPHSDSHDFPAGLWWACTSDAILMETGTPPHRITCQLGDQQTLLVSPI